MFYSGRLHVHSGRESVAVAGDRPFDGAGIRFTEVDVLVIYWTLFLSTVQLSHGQIDRRL